MLKSLALVIIAALTVSFTTIKKETKKINVEKSSIEWVGKKITGQHSGVIAVKEGSLKFKNNKLVGGVVIVNMTSLTVTDLSGDYKNKLERHLKSDDFFGVDKFETSTLTINKVTGENGSFLVNGDITIKGITKPISFDMTVNGNIATAELKIDRTQFGIRYGSASFFDDLQDKAINNEFELKVQLSI